MSRGVMIRDESVVCNRQSPVSTFYVYLRN